jgi:hypothetical protein
VSLGPEGLLSTTEYQQWFDYGRLPERLWDGQIAAWKHLYVMGKLTLEEFEAAIDIMMGLQSSG